MFDAAAATAGFAWRIDNLAGAPAGAAGARYRKESLLKAHLAAALTSPADFRPGSRGGSRARARFAGLVLGNPQLGCHPRGRLFQCNLEIVSQVGAAL